MRFGQLVDFETGIQRLGIIAVAVNHPFNALDGNVGYFFETDCVGWYRSFDLFWQLNEDKLSVTVILFVEFENGLGGRAGASKEIQNNFLFI